MVGIIVGYLIYLLGIDQYITAAIAVIIVIFYFDLPIIYILGIKRSSETLWISAISGVLSVIIFTSLNFLNFSSFDLTLIGIVVNSMMFFMKKS